LKKKKSQIENEDLDGQLREKALEMLAQFPVVPGEMPGKTPEEVIHELQVHQIELEMQNEELRNTQLALEESRQRYSDLYHFAPVGYFTITPEALIKEVNLAGSALLGVTRQKLINARFRRIVTAKDQNLWDQHFLSVLQEEKKQTCELMLKRQDGSTFYAGLESIRMEVSRGAFLVHTTVTDITERKHMEEVVRQSEARYRTAVIEEIEEGYYEVDLAGNFTFVNNSMIRQLQYSREELIGMNYRTYIPPEEVEGVYKTFNRVFRTGEIIKRYPVTNIRKDGTAIIMEDSISCLRDREGRVVGFRGICRDITERKQAEEALRSSEDRYRDLVEKSQDLICTHDLEGNLLSLNEAPVKALGYSRESLLHTKMSDLLAPELRDLWRAYLKEIQEKGRASGILRLQTAAGETRFWEYNNTLRTEGVSVPLVRGMAHDVTERRLAEKKLKESEKLYRSLFKNMLNGFAYCRMLFEDGKPQDFIYLAVNDAFESLTGLKNVVGRKVTEVIPTFREANQRLLEIYGRVAMTSQPKRFEMFVDALQKWFSVSAYSPAQEHFVAVFDVINERKEAEQKLLKYQKQLQSLAIRLSEVEEMERKEIARTLHDLVGQNLTALNLNLTIIFGMMPEDQNPLRISRLEDSQKLLEETTQHIRDVISELRPSVLDDFGVLAALRWYGRRFNGMTGIQTKVEGKKIPSRLPPLLETIIFRIAQEALTNVLKHASAGRVDLRLEKVKDRMQLTITDDGRGFNFKGVDFGGEKRGWGLAMMRERAIALGGDLQIYSEPGKGTRIILQLPVEL